MLDQESSDVFLREPEKQNIIRKYKSIQKCLKHIDIKLPDAIRKKIIFPHEKQEYKRLLRFFITAIKTFAYHRQYQGRKTHSAPGEGGSIRLYQFAEMEDVIDAIALFKSLYTEGLHELDPLYARGLKDILALCEKKAETNDLAAHEQIFDLTDIWTAGLGWTKRTLKTVLWKLLADEYIVKTYGHGRSAHYYRLNVDRVNPFNAIELRLLKDE